MFQEENGMCKGPVAGETMGSARTSKCTSMARPERVRGSMVPDRPGEGGKEKRLPA